MSTTYIIHLESVDTHGLWLEKVRVVACGTDGVDLIWSTSIFNVARFVARRLPLQELLSIESRLHAYEVAFLPGAYSLDELEDLRERLAA